MKLRVENETALAKLAADLGTKLKRADVLCLYGGLGAGKTAFCRALVNALADEPEEVPSPTFTLVQVYDLPTLSIWHFDLYRLPEQNSDILELGWEEARRSGVALIEWPERLGGLLPRDRLDINIDFEHDSENARQVTLTPHGVWAGRLGEI